MSAMKLGAIDGFLCFAFYLQCLELVRNVSDCKSSFWKKFTLSWKGRLHVASYPIVLVAFYLSHCPRGVHSIRFGGCKDSRVLTCWGLRTSCHRSAEGQGTVSQLMTPRVPTVMKNPRSLVLLAYRGPGTRWMVSLFSSGTSCRAMGLLYNSSSQRQIGKSYQHKCVLWFRCPPWSDPGGFIFWV